MLEKKTGILPFLFGQIAWLPTFLLLLSGAASATSYTGQVPFYMRGYGPDEILLPYPAGSGGAHVWVQYDVHIQYLGPPPEIYGVSAYVESASASGWNVGLPTMWGDPHPYLPYLNYSVGAGMWYGDDVWLEYEPWWHYVMSGSASVTNVILVDQLINGQWQTEKLRSTESFSFIGMPVESDGNLSSEYIEHIPIHITLGGRLGPPDEPVVKPPLVKPEDSCGQCLACNAGVPAVNAALHSVDVSIELGKVPGTTRSAKMILKSPQPDKDNFNPKFFGYENAELAPAFSTPEQIISDTTVVVIEDTDPEDYELILHFYTRDPSIALETDGTYELPPGAQAFATITLDDPTPLATVRSLRIHKDAGGSEQEWLYDWVSPSSSLQLTHSSGSNESSESLHSEVDSLTGDRIETRIRRDSTGTPVSKTRSVFHTFAFGERMISSTEDPDGRALTTTWNYQETLLVNGYGEIRSIVTPEGSWEFYEYDTASRIVRTYSQIGNAALPTSPSFGSTAVEDWIYTDYVAGPPAIPGMLAVINYRAGVEVARRYRVAHPDGYDDVQCQAEGAAWDAASNLVTAYRYETDAEGALRPVSVRLPDQKEIRYTYEMLDAADDPTLDKDEAVLWITRTETGVPDSITDLITSGTRTETATNRVGNTVYNQTWDISSGLLTSHQQTNSWDAGRPVEMENALSGRTMEISYNCCGIDSRTDERGNVTTYAKTPASESSTFGGVTTTTTRSGLTTVVTRTGSDSTILEQSRSTSNLAGEMIQRHSRQGTEIFAHDTFSGYRRETTTYSDGGTRVELFMQDGAPYSVTGTAVSPVRYETGVTQVTVDGLTFNSQWTRTIALDATGTDTAEWTKTWTDMQGRTWKTETSAGDTALQQYDVATGNLVRQTSPDGIVTLHATTADGMQQTIAVDMDQDGVIDYDGTDRITRTTKSYATRAGIAVERNTMEVWGTDNTDTPTVLYVKDRSLDGLQSWTTEGTLTAQKIEAPGPGGWDGNWTVTAIQPDGSTMVETFTAGRLVSQVWRDSANAVIDRSDFQYDSHGRLWKTTDGRNATTTRTYEQQNNPVSGAPPVTADLLGTILTPPRETGGTGILTTLAYDTMGREEEVTDALNGKVETTYYPTGQVHTISGSRAYPSSFTYTDQGRLDTMTTTTAAGPAVTTWVYHATSGLLHQKKLNGSTVYTHTYGSGGRVATSTNARGTVTAYSYTNGGDQESVSYSDSTPDITLAYNRLGQVKTISNGVLTNTLDINIHGQLQAEAWTGGYHDGLELTRSFDALKRQNGLAVTQAAAPLAGYALGFDQASRVQTVSAGNLSAAYAYVAQSRLPDSITFKRNSTVYATADYEFDLAGSLKWIKYQDGSNALHTGSTYEVNDLSRRTRVTREDGSRWDWGYNDRGEIISASRKFSDASPVPFDQFTYAYDALGNRLSSSVAGRETGYTSNLLSQYTGRTNPGYAHVSGEAQADANLAVNAQIPVRKGTLFWQELIAPNASAGAYLPVTVHAAKPGAGPGGTDLVTHETGALYTPPAAQALTYDADGNLLTDGRWTYTWDGASRLIAMEEQASASLTAAGLNRQKLEFTYDPFSRRATKQVSAWNAGTSSWDLQRRTVFVWDGWNLMAELEGTSSSAPALKRSYVWGLDIGGSITASGGIGGLLFENTGSAWVSPAYDGNGNVLGLIDTVTGSVAARYEYSPFGVLLRASGSLATDNPIRFSSRYHDTESGLSYYGHRYYSAELGRWLSTDPIEEDGGLNLSGFVENNPVNSIDIHGLRGVATPPAPPLPAQPGPGTIPKPGTFPGIKIKPGVTIKPGVGPRVGLAPLIGALADEFLTPDADPETSWEDPRIKEFERTAGDKSGNLCKILAAIYGHKIFYSPTSWNRATGVFAILTRKQKGEEAQVEPPGYNAAISYKRGSVDKGHLLPKSVGGNGQYENIITQQSGHNRLVYHVERDIMWKLKNPSTCAVCVMILPTYRPKQPAPFGIIYVSVLATSSSNQSHYHVDVFSLPRIFGHLQKEGWPWNVTTGYYYRPPFMDSVVFKLN